jgi:hypothetical protein
MDRPIHIDPAATKLRRVGRLARRRMRIDADALRNGVHTDGTATVEIRGLGSPAAGVPESFEWTADRPIALVIVRAGLDGEDVQFHVDPGISGRAQGSLVGDGSGIRYVAFCYDAPVEAPGAVVAPPAGIDPVGVPFAPTPRDRRSILSWLRQRPTRRLPGTSLA